MNIVKPYARLMGVINPMEPFTRTNGVDLLRKIELLGRFSHASEDSQSPTSWERFIPAVVMGHGDWSIVEHASVTVDFLVDRGVSHELVRHRLFSFTQSSTRFINYAKKMEPSFIVPPFDSVSNDPSTGNEVYESARECAQQAWEYSIAKAEESYQTMVRCGAAPQIARSVFPNALSTRIAVTGNLRNWRHLMIMRTTKETHPQFREVSIPLLVEFREKIPMLFDDILPMQTQASNLRLPR